MIVIDFVDAPSPRPEDARPRAAAKAPTARPAPSADRYADGHGVPSRYRAEGRRGAEAAVPAHGFFGSLRGWFDYGYVDALRDSHSLVPPRWHADRVASAVLDSVHPCAADPRPLAEAVRSLESWIGGGCMPAAGKTRFLANDLEAPLAAVAEDRADRSKAPAGGRDAIAPKVREAARLSPLVEARETPGADHGGAFARRGSVVTEIRRFLARSRERREASS